MEIAILIIAHLLYVGRVLHSLSIDKAAVIFSSVLLTLLCWKTDTTWGIVTLCYTFLMFLILLLNSKD